MEGMTRTGGGGDGGMAERERKAPLPHSPAIASQLLGMQR